MAWTDTGRKNEGHVSSGLTVQATLNSTAAGSMIAVATSSWLSSSHAVADDVNGSYGSPIVNVANTDQRNGLFVFPNNAGGNITVTLTCNSSSGNKSIFVHEFAGGALSAPQSGSANSATGSGNPQNPGTIAPPDDDVLALAVVGGGAGTITENAGGEGFTLSNEHETDTPGQPTSFVFKIISGDPGTVGHTWTGVAGIWAAGIAAFKAAPSDPVYEQSDYQVFNDDSQGGLGEAA